MTLTRAGAFSAFICSATYIFGFALLALFIAPAGVMPGETEIASYVGFLIQNQGLMSLWYLVIYVVNAIFLAILVVSLAQMIRPSAPDCRK